MKMNKINLILLLILLLLFSGVADAELMNSSWAKYMHDQQNTGQSNITSSSNGSLKWNITANQTADDSFAVTTNGDIWVTLDLGSYNNIELYYSNGSLKCGYKMYDTIDSSIALDDNGTAYVGGGVGGLYAINSNCNLKWNTTIGGVYGTASGSSPNIDNNLIFAAGDNGHLYALNISNGDIVWDTNVARYGIYQGEIYGSSPAVVNDIVLIGSTGNNNLSALNATTGKFLWNYTLEDYIYQSPLVDVSRNLVYIMSRYATVLHAINLNNGTVNWSKSLNASLASHGIGMNKNGELYLSLTNGNLTVLYPNQTIKGNFSLGYSGGCVYSSRSVPAFDNDGVAYIGGYAANIYAINPNLTLKWNYILSQNEFCNGGAVSSSPTIGLNGEIYIGKNNYFYAFDSQIPAPASFDPSGYVRNWNGLPVQDTLVTFWNATYSISTTTNPLGYYEVLLPANGFYDFVASKDGYADTIGYGTFTNGTSCANGGTCTNLTLYNVNINGTVYNAKNGTVLSGVNVDFVQTNYYSNGSSYHVTNTTGADGKYSFTGFIINKPINIFASKTGYLQIENFSVTPLQAGNYLMNLYMMPEAPCPNAVCGLTVSYPWYQILGSVNVTLSNATYSNYIFSNITTGYFEIPVSADGTYNLSGAFNKFTTTNKSITVTGGTNVSYLILHPIYNLTIKARNYATTDFISDFWAYKDGVGTSSINRTVIYQVDYSFQTVSVQASSYQPLQKNIFVSQDTTTIFDLYSAGQSITYQGTFHNVRFTVQDIYGNKKSGVNVTVQGQSTTLGSWTWLKGLLGIDYQTYTLHNTSMSGITGIDGSITFLMIETIYYKINSVNISTGINQTDFLYPKSSEYYIIIDTPQTSTLTYNLSHSPTDITLTWTTNKTINNLNFTILKNNTNLVHQLITNNTTGQSIYTVTDLNSKYYVYLTVSGSSYIRSEVINYQAGKLREDCGLGKGCIVGWGSGNNRFELPQWMYNNTSMLLVWIVAGSFGALFASFGAIIALILILLFTFWGWLQGVGIGLSFIGTITILAIVNYLRHKE